MRKNLVLIALALLVALGSAVSMSQLNAAKFNNVRSQLMKKKDNGKGSQGQQ